LYATVKNWVAQIKRGNFSTCVAPRTGLSKTVTTPEIIDQIHELILEDGWISVKSIDEQLGISVSGLGPSFMKIWTCQSSEQFLEFFRRDSIDLLSRLVTMDDNWLYHHDPETKQQSMEFRHSGSPLPPRPVPKNFRVQKSAEKFLASIFLDQDGILLIDYIPKGQTINAEYYSSMLVQLKDILKGKRRGKVVKVLLFLHDNVPAHRALATQ